MKSLNRKSGNFDFGPNALNIKAGVTAVGARMPLVAFNVNLGTDDVEIAKKIAKIVKSKNRWFHTLQGYRIRNS